MRKLNPKVKQVRDPRQNSTQSTDYVATTKIQAESDRDSIDVVIVTFNASQVIDQCLRPLMNDGRLNVIVVDNCSTDNTIDLVGQYNVRVVQSTRNLGFGAASNLGASLGNAKQLLFLNPDTIADPEAIRAAADYALRSGVGVLGCRLVTLTGEFDHAARRNVVRPWAAAKYLVNRSKSSDYLASHLSESEVAEVDAVNGAFMLLDRETFNSVGGFDEDYWMYMEDVDLCIRVKGRGKPVIYWPEITVVHIKSAITGRSRSPRMNYHFYRSLAVFYKKHQQTDDIFPLRVATIFGIWTFFGYAVVRDTIRRLVGTGTPYSAPLDPQPRTTPDLDKAPHSG